MFHKIDQIAIGIVGVLLLWAWVDPESLKMVFGFMDQVVRDESFIKAAASLVVGFPFALGIAIMLYAFGVFLRETGILGAIALTAAFLAIIFSVDDTASRIFATIAYLADIPGLLHSGKKLDGAITDLTHHRG